MGTRERDKLELGQQLNSAVVMRAVRDEDQPAASATTASATTASANTASATTGTASATTASATTEAPRQPPQDNQGT